MYYSPETGETFSTHSEIRSKLQGVIFEESITNEALSFVNVFPLHYEKPVVDEGRIAEPFAVENIDGVWTQLWNVRDASQEELQPKHSAVPSKVTRRQARQALLIHKSSDGIPLIDLVESAIASIEDEQQRRLAQIAWEDATEFERYDLLVLQIGDALGLDEARLDVIFTFANTL